MDFKLLTGCMVPPAIITALHSFSTWAKWTAGFNSRNLMLLSDKVPGQIWNTVVVLFFWCYCFVCR